MKGKTGSRPSGVKIQDQPQTLPEGKDYAEQNQEESGIIKGYLFPTDLFSKKIEVEKR